MTARVSVIIPAFNCENYLQEAVESAILNSWSEKEIIIFDDGSTDRTREVAEKLRDKYVDLVRVLSHAGGRNYGLPKTRNEAVKNATGELIAFLDADDRFLPDHLTHAVQALSEYPQVAFTYGRVRYLQSGKTGSWILGDEWGTGPRYGVIHDIFERLLRANFIPVMTVVCRKELFLDTGGFVGRVEFGDATGVRFPSDEHLLWTMLAYRHAVFYVDKVCADYRKHPESRSNKRWKRLDRESVASAGEVEYLARVAGWVPFSDHKARQAINDAWTDIGNRVLYRLYRAVRRSDWGQARSEATILRHVPVKTQLVTAPFLWYSARLESRRRLRLEQKQEAQTARANTVELDEPIRLSDQSNLRVSIIIPAYNCERYLAEAVMSAISCSWDEKEVIIFNDGSTDRTGEVAAQLERAYPSLVRAFSHPDGLNHGLSRSRNSAAEKATGDVIAFLDADDRFLSNHPVNALEVLTRFPEVVFTYGRIRYLVEVDTDQLWFTGTEWGSGPGRGFVLDAFELLLFGNFIPVQTVVCRRDQFTEVGGFDDGLQFLQQDYVLWTKLAAKYPPYYLDQVCAEYRVHSSSYTFNLDREKVAGHQELEFLERISAWLSTSDYKAQHDVQQAWHRLGERSLYRLYRSMRKQNFGQASKELQVLRRVPGKPSLVDVPMRWYRAHLEVEHKAKGRMHRLPQ